MVMGYLPRLEQLKMQGLDKWWYVTGVGRVQVRLDLQKMVYFAHPDGGSFIMAVSKTGECQRFSFKGESALPDRWGGCQVGKNHFFLLDNDEYRFRILKMDPTQRCFSIEREGDQPIGSGDLCYSLANFKDEFVFLFSTEGSHRYSLTEDKWEKLPRIRLDEHLSACSLGDKVYVLDHVKRAI